MIPPRIMALLLAAAVLSACAAGSAPVKERQPEDLRRSIRYLNRGTSFYNKGCYPHAAHYFQKAHEMFAAADNLKGAADSLNSLANAYYRLSEMPSAVLVYDEAADYYQLLENRKGRIRALSNKSVALSSVGKFRAAETAIDQADAVANGDDILLGLRLKARAILKLKTDEIEQAKELMQRAFRYIPKGAAGQYASAQYTMGHVLLHGKAPGDAIAYLERALEVDQKSGAYFSIAQDLETLGDCHAAVGKHAQAVHYYKRSMKIFALLERAEQVAQITPRLQKSAAKAELDITATQHWIEQWTKARWELSICR